jgi:hypothetical protein
MASRNLLGDVGALLKTGLPMSGARRAEPRRVVNTTAPPMSEKFRTGGVDRRGDVRWPGVRSSASGDGLRPRRKAGVSCAVI